MNLWDLYGLEKLALEAGYNDGDRPDHSFGLLVYSLIYSERAKRVVCIGYGSGYIPVLASAGQAATGRRGSVLSIDPLPCDRGGYVNDHGFTSSHIFLQGDPVKSAGHVLERLGGLIDVLVVIKPEDFGPLWQAYQPLLADTSLCILQGIGEDATLPGYNSIGVWANALIARRIKG